MNRLVAAAPVLALLALLALFAGYSLHRKPHIEPTALVGKPLPDIALPPLAGGGALPLRSLAKGPLLLNLYASWCGPCADEAPALLALKAEGVEIIGIAYRDTPANASAFLARYGDPYKVALSDRDGRAGIDLGATGVPETLAIDRFGVIRAKQAGPITPADAEGLLAKASD